MIKKYEWSKSEILEAEKEILNYPKTKNRPYNSDRFLENKGAIRNGENGTITVINIEAYEKFSSLVEAVYNFIGKRDFAIKKRLESYQEKLSE